MISVVCFKWKPGPARPLPSQSVVGYTAAHVNTLKNMVRRHLHVPHEFVCITDDDTNLDSDIRTIPLWDKCRDQGACYNRLFAYSKEAAFIGSEILMIDLDAVIVGDITPLVRTGHDFVINKYRGNDRPGQYYNGGLVYMKAGARSEIWDDFDPKATPGLMDVQNAEKYRVGSDQAWISCRLGPNEAVFDAHDGVYEALWMSDVLPLNARLVLFAGPRDPSLAEFQARYPWIAAHYH